MKGDAEIDVTLADGRAFTLQAPGGSSPYKTKFYYEDGNGSCDCALADLIRAQFDPTFPELPCGVTVKVLAIRITGVSDAELDLEWTTTGGD